MSNINKKFKKVNSSGLRKPVFVQNVVTEISARKGGIRTNIEKAISPDTYDIYDIVADMANALNEVLADGVTHTGPAITKYKTRQTQIAKITSKY